MKKTVLDQVRKLLAKAESCSKFGTPEGDAEAQAFTEKAQQMIAEYAIDEAMLHAANKTREDVGSREFRIPAPYAMEKATLLHVVAKANRVQVIVTDKDRTANLKVVAVGFASDIEATDILFTSLMVQMTSELLSAEHGGRTWGQVTVFRRNFCHGFTNRVGERLREINRRAEQDHEAKTGSSTALVLRDRNQLVAEKYRELFPNAKMQRRTYQSDRGGRAAGYDAGGRANLGQPGIGSRRALSA